MLELTLAFVVSRRNRSRGEEAALLQRYLARARRYGPCEAMFFEDEAALLRGAERAPGRGPARVFLCDPRGRMVSSEELAEIVRGLRDGGTGRAMFAIGPADGWSDGARAGTDGVLSFGRITLPHELAQVVIAEQIYRALTILAGHPYHCGH